LALINSTFSFWNAVVRNCSQPPRWVAWTGDTSVWGSSQQSISDISIFVAATLAGVVDLDRTRVMPSLGNNDVENECLGPKNMKTVLGNFALAWQAFLPPGSMKTFMQGGYYVSELDSGRSVIALNTMLWTQRNAALSISTCATTNDVGTMQFDWLESVLNASVGSGHTFYVTGHIPPIRSNGNKIYWPACQSRYMDIALRYQALIVGHIFADTHNDQFEILANGAASIFMAPSFHPTHNPALRFWRTNSQSGALMDYAQYYLSLNDANNGTDTAEHLEYTPSAAFQSGALGSGYGLRNLNLTSMQWLESQLTPNSTWLEQYLFYRSVSYPDNFKRSTIRQKNQEDATAAEEYHLWRKYPRSVIDQECGSWS
jgi:hypothetical protein